MAAVTWFRGFSRQVPHTEAQAACEHRDTSTREDVASGDPDRRIWWCRDCGQSFEYSQRAVEAAAWQQEVARLLCACGAPIPAARRGQQRCSTECDEAAARREREAEWREAFDSSVAQYSEWYLQQRLKELS